MFTGIIEEIGIVKDFRQGKDFASICVECKNVLNDSKIGDSIAINGVCQTVVTIDANSFSVQISEETLKVTNFSTLAKGQEVNLERALTFSQRLGGHMVSGHVDFCTKINKIEKKSDFYDVHFEIPKNFKKYFVSKGSVAVNGISLTIANISPEVFQTAIIPHTFENTNLKHLNEGAFVNIEIDILAKYVEKFLSTNNNKEAKSANIDEHFLKENGFL